MSWQQYVDQMLVATGHIDKAAIFSAAGDSVWAATPGFTVKPEEVKALIKAYTNPSDVQSKGCFISGDKYMVVKADERSIYGKKEKHGIVCVKSNQAVLIAHYPEGVQAGQANTTVEKLADYLIGVGY